MPARKPSSGKRASKKTVKATETKFGKAARVAAERGGKKPTAWQQSEAPKRSVYVAPSAVVAPKPATPADGPRTLHGIVSAAVEQGTGKGWDAWVAALDADDGRRMTHKELVTHLRGEYKLHDTWSERVATGYEEARGLRDKATGLSITSTRTMDASVSGVFRAFNDPTRRGWMHERLYSVQAAVAPRMLKLAMPDGSVVSVAIQRQGNTRTLVNLEQSKIADAAAAERARQAWRGSLERLAVMLDE